jgi:hypothetical protein
LPDLKSHDTLASVNTYHPVQIGADLWTVEWIASGVALGHVHGVCASELEAIIAAFIMNERESSRLIKPQPHAPHARRFRFQSRRLGGP